MPKTAQDYANEAYTLLNNNNPAEAELLLRKAVEIDPSNDEYLYNLADLCYEQKRFRDAEYYFHQCLHYKPEDHEVQFYLFNCLAEQSRHLEALFMLKDAIELIEEKISLQGDTSLDTDEIEYYLALAFQNKKLGFTHDARIAAEKAIKLYWLNNEDTDEPPEIAILTKLVEEIEKMRQTTGNNPSTTPAPA